MAKKDHRAENYFYKSGSNSKFNWNWTIESIRCFEYRGQLSKESQEPKNQGEGISYPYRPISGAYLLVCQKVGNQMMCFRTPFLEFSGTSDHLKAGVPLLPGCSG